MKNLKKILSLMVVFSLVLGTLCFVAIDNPKDAKAAPVDYTKWAILDSAEFMYQFVYDNGSNVIIASEDVPAHLKAMNYPISDFTATNTPWFVHRWSEFDLTNADTILNQLPTDLTDIIISDRFVISQGDNGYENAKNNFMNRAEAIIGALRAKFPNAKLHFLSSLPMTADNPRIYQPTPGGSWAPIAGYPNLAQDYINWGWVHMATGGGAANADTGLNAPTINGILSIICDEYDVNYIDINVAELIDTDGTLKNSYAEETSWGYHLNEAGVELVTEAFIESVEEAPDQNPGNNDQDNDQDNDNNDQDNNDQDNNDQDQDQDSNLGGEGEDEGDLEGDIDQFGQTTHMPYVLAGLGLLLAAGVVVLSVRRRSEA